MFRKFHNNGKNDAQLGGHYLHLSCSLFSLSVFFIANPAFANTYIVNNISSPSKHFIATTQSAVNLTQSGTNKSLGTSNLTQVNNPEIKIEAEPVPEKLAEEFDDIAPLDIGEFTDAAFEKGFEDIDENTPLEGMDEIALPWPSLTNPKKEQEKVELATAADKIDGDIAGNDALVNGSSAIEVPANDALVNDALVNADTDNFKEEIGLYSDAQLAEILAQDDRELAQFDAETRNLAAGQMQADGMVAETPQIAVSGNNQGQIAVEGAGDVIALFDEARTDFTPPIPDADGLYNYKIAIAGFPELEGEQKMRFDSLSELKLREGQPANIDIISNRAQADRKLIDQLARIEGYYDNQSEFIIRAGDVPGSAIVQINTELGPLYRVRRVELNGLAKYNDDSDMLRASFTMNPGDPLNSDKLLLAMANLTTTLLESGYPFSKVGRESIIVDHASVSGDVTLDVDSNGRYNFGKIIVTNNRPFDAGHLNRLARFQNGDLYKESLVSDLKQAIFSTALASSVTVTPTKSDNNKQEVDLVVNINEAPPRSIAGEFGYNSGEGIRVEGSWEHRNFFPPEGAIRFGAILGTKEQGGNILYRRNNFLGRDRIFTAQFKALHENRSAYDARTLSLSANFESKSTIFFQKPWTWFGGAEYLLTDEKATFDNVVTRQLFNVGALPFGIFYDGSDNLLDPSKGFRLGARLSPEISLGNGTNIYARVQLDASVYQKVTDNIVLAGRSRVATISGATINQIAPSRRYYAGGGGSVRGFAFQKIGPVDSLGDPTGGRGLMEFSLESRIKFGNFGIVPFVDVGSVSDSSLPDFNDLRVGVGIGGRYYSSFGPIAVDIGTPINRRTGESRIAISISLGQAF
ncbi:hypothetical protein LPB140_05965 [Sphingorhabdus lutea]|uniref:Outer membrane protein assembly factor n=1 Tax=Sphingorhabdus lutea TaxID=1913578 RepID=A0A1L3JBC5_9SPHN|nr:BamA/TamA family outer membrane protein [Sphingorhabdus lutea]APG62416.1 hypothetical protein LPB140_05965 [Sphingorhabdus lutea]